MKNKLSDYNLSFELDGLTFKVLNLVFEKFERHIPLHSHGTDSFELHIIPYGYGEALIDNVRYKITPGSIFMTGPFINHSQTPDKNDPMCEYCIYFKVTPGPSTSKKTSTLSKTFLNTPFCLVPDTINAAALSKELFDELTVRKEGYETVAESLLRQLIVKLIRTYPGAKEKTPESATTDTYESSSLIIEEAFLYEYDSITLERLSTKLGLSNRQTERLINEKYHKSFAAKKAEAKMSAAAMALTTTKKSITEIAMDVGYSSIEHFSAAFKKYHSISPKEYRKKNS